MRRICGVVGALFVLSACGEGSAPTQIRVENWPVGQPPRPFTASDSEARDCRVELVFDSVDLPPKLHAPSLRVVPSLEGALNSVSLDACYFDAATSYVFVVDFDGDADSDFLARRPASAGAGCSQPAVGVVEARPDGLSEFTPIPGLSHAFVVGSLNADSFADLVEIEADCAQVRWFHADTGFVHDDVSQIGCGEAIGSGENTVTTWDLDRDGDLDLFLATDGPNYVFRNEGGTFVEATADVGLTPEGAYPYDPDDASLAGDEPFDPTRAHSFYVYCDSEDPFDPLSPTICQVDNDGPVSFNESYRCDEEGGCTWIDDRVAAACDVMTTPLFERFVCDEDVSPEAFDEIVEQFALARGQPADRVLRIAHSSGSPEHGDGTNPMSIARFGIWPYAFEHKSQSEGVVSDTVVVYDAARAHGDEGGWLSFDPYSIENGRSSHGHDQQTWGSLALEDGYGWPVLLTAHGKLGRLDELSGWGGTDILEDILGTALPCRARPESDVFGVSDVGVTVVTPEGRLASIGELVESSEGDPVSTGPIARTSVYRSVTSSWISPAGGGEPALHVTLGGFDGLLHAYEVEPAGNLLRLALDPGEGRAPHGYGAVLVVELDGRLRGPKTVGADGVQPQLGNHRDSWDFGLGDAARANVYVRWAWGEREAFMDVEAGPELAVLVHGTGSSTEWFE